MRRRFVPLVLGSLLGGCTAGADFHAPEVAAPALWGPERTDVASRTVQGAVQADWWRSFRDGELDALVARLVARNLELQEAAERVLQGIDATRIAASAGLPNLSARASYERMRESPTGSASLVVPAPGAPLAFDLFRDGLSSSWQLDLFGRVRRAVEAADARTLAARDVRRGVALTALATLAQDYVQLRGIQARRTIAEDNLRIAEQNVRLVQDRFANGVATTLDMAQARSALATLAATVPTLRAQEAALINAIGLLLAERPRALEAELKPRARVPEVPAIVPIGLPGELVRRRPDVMEAEARLRAATAETGVAVADFYPDVSLTGAFNLEGLRLRDAFSLPSRAFDVGPSISIPIFQGGRLRGQLQLRRSQEREAAIAFQRTVLAAWREADDALTAYAEAQRRRGDVSEAVRQNRAALEAARQRYQEGVADFLNVLSSQTSLLQSENALADSQTEIALDLVQLYRALGGGWEVSEPAPASR